jgi:hypothetical protein
VRPTARTRGRMEERKDGRKEGGKEGGKERTAAFCAVGVKVGFQCFSRDGVAVITQRGHFMWSYPAVTFHRSRNRGGSGICIRRKRGGVLGSSAREGTSYGRCVRYGLGTAWRRRYSGFACDKPSRMLVSCANLQKWWFSSHFAPCALVARCEVSSVCFCGVYSFRAAVQTYIAV